ncbi:hypothetical protein B0A55_06369 [Friedmanniomyces simplex]|uniref:Uncharacterized protein n=1 Tax=Friedmanniomyces simplex TaxID=329884 RepID=A0A4U0X9T0_9PEZI|nr:hypothetical protein B0A55_06369 [Friedmanniomyces simplex]
MSGRDDADENRRRQYQAPYTGKHTIPTVQRYREEKEDRKATAADSGGDEVDDGAGSSSRQRAKDYWQVDKEGEGEDARQGAEGGSHGHEEHEEEKKDDVEQYPDEDPSVTEDTSQTVSGSAKDKWKSMKKRKDERAEREVTDPVTHLPVTIHDFTSQALKDIAENDTPVGSTPRTATGLSNKNKSGKQLQKEWHETEQGRQNMQALYPPPEYNRVREHLAEISKRGVSMGLGGAVAVMLVAVGLERVLRAETDRQETSRFLGSIAVWVVLGLLSVAAVWALNTGVRNWMGRRIESVWDDEIWEANRGSEKQQAKAHENESVAWLNSLLAAVWPLVNPDLFTSVADQLEDIMQASLPSMVHMVSVDDIGQGSESIRILGVRWLPTGAAARSVGSNGKLKNEDQTKKEQSDRTVPGQGEVDGDTKDEQSGDGEEGDTEQKDDGAQTEVAEGMEAEEGDFICLEVAFAYRARSSMKKFQDRTKDMHLYIAFYLPGRLKVPVWVDLRGIVGTMRLRLQLAPDPPFFALCTLTFLGQPKVDISCVPLVKKGLNIMDLPLISNFVQSSVDAAMAEYVAPKSLTLDLKDMLAGDDFKKDTSARGVLVVRIKRGYDFKTGDPGIPFISEGGADPYVSVGWAKLGRRCGAFLLVTPDELNVDERLRVQLWDSDRFTADDDLGRIEVDLKQLMRDPETNGKMQCRKDGFRALKAGEDEPGKLEWDVGYFSKARIQQCQFEQQTYDKKVRSMEQLQKKVDEVCERKLREAHIKGGEARDEEELKQQKAQERKSREDGMIISAPPPQGFPSGVFSIQIHQITGLELQTLNKGKADKSSEKYDNAETGDELPSAYCTVMINHAKVFRTRTKPKNAKPFYNAGVERFVPDWQNCEVYVAVRDARVREDDPLLGIVHLPLHEVFKHRAQINGFYPLMGGVGFGRIRISMVWRSVQLKAPAQELGWQYGTLEVRSGVRGEGGLPAEVRAAKVRLGSDIDYVKMYPRVGGKKGETAGEAEGGEREEEGEEWGTWESRKGRSLVLPFQKRYCSPLAIEFTRHGVLGAKKTAAFAILWLRDIADEEETELTLPVWKGDFKRARACCVEVCGEQVGAITLTVTFWSGLGGAHSRWANGEPGMREVVEVLQVARDNMETVESAKRAGVVDEEAGSSGSSSGEDSSSDESEGEGKGEGGEVSGGGGQVRPDGDLKTEGKRMNGAAGEHASATDGDEEEGGGKSGKRNLLDSAREYKRHMKSEHRRHRGIMQWRIPRTANHAVHKVESAGSKIGGLFRRHTREPDVETEA